MHTGHSLSDRAFSVRIRRKAQATIDRSFATLKEAVEFEGQRPALLDNARSLSSPSMTLEAILRALWTYTTSRDTDLKCGVSLRMTCGVPSGMGDVAEQSIIAGAAR
ncbi:MAG: hypothetical protein BroJett031_19270 [Betaproteobacteria bacterium]|nr:MAG: hypothetical protein BroJett031_19270 [Betaproteobacteria bacterium]